MVNESTSLIRRIFWMISIGVAASGFLLMVGTYLDTSNWSVVFLVGFIVFMLGYVFTVITNDPIAFAAKFAAILIAFNYILYRVFSIHTNITRKCYRLYRKYHKNLDHVYCSAYNAIYDSHPIDTIVYRKD
jgi:CBS domain containing-hemolysin-like protein|nr:MAG TPA: hypothetical protein [Caudoviricetes sp.]